MADVASISMEHQDCQIAREAPWSLPKKKGMQGLPVGRGDLEIFKVADAKLARTGDVCARIHGDIAGVDEFTGGNDQLRKQMA